MSYSQEADEQLEILRQQIANSEVNARKVDSEAICKIYQKVLKDRTPQDYQSIVNFLWFCNLFVTIRNAKVISEASVIDLIKHMRWVSLPNSRNTNVYTYGSTQTPGNNNKLKEMEAFIVIKGRVGIKAPKCVHRVSQRFLVDRYEDVLWEKTHNGD
jgi:hypothetical protein